MIDFLFYFLMCPAIWIADARQLLSHRRRDSGLALAEEMATRGSRKGDGEVG